MGKPKYYWYYLVKKMILELPAVEDSLQGYIFQKAIDDAIKETRLLPNGDYRVQAIQYILITKRMDYQAAATTLNFDVNTIKRWIASFIKLVGKKAGF